MSVALRSDPITFGDLQDALVDAQERFSETFEDNVSGLRVSLDSHHEDIARLLDVIDALNGTVASLVAKLAT